MHTEREILPNPVKGFLVDMGRWRKVASIDKALQNEVGWEWQIQFIRPLDDKGRRFLVEAVYNPPRNSVVTETRYYTAGYADADLPKEEEKKEPVMGEDVFSKTQMRKVQAMLDAEHVANRNLAEELSREKAKNSELKELIEGLRELGTQTPNPIVKKVKAPSFAKEKRAQETEFTMLRNCVMSRLSELERFDCDNIRHCAEACGLKERGLDATKFVRSTTASLVKLGHIELAGERNGKKTYRLTEKGLDYLKEVRKDEHN